MPLSASAGQASGLTEDRRGMGDNAASDQPRGLFKRETKGFVTAPVTLQLERGRMQFFAHLLGETDPIFNDPMAARAQGYPDIRSEEHTSELQSLMRISYAVFCLK